MAVKTITWINNDQIPQHPRAKLLYHVWKLNYSFFLWKKERNSLKIQKDGSFSRERRTDLNLKSKVSKEKREII